MYPHAICSPCFEARTGGLVKWRAPTNAPAERCCFCGREARTGIFVRGAAGACTDPGHSDESDPFVEPSA